MRARSALFDVYGDHLRARGDRARVSALIRLLEPVGIQPPAVRTAISRMAGQGWLESVRVDTAPGYRATPRAIARLDEAADRIYRRTPKAWHGRWDVLFTDLPTSRAARARLRQELGYLGYAEYATGVWVCPFHRPEADGAVVREGGTARHAVAVEFEDDPVRAWDLGALAASYAAWPEAADAIVRRQLATHDDEAEASFAARFELVHEWRKFLFDDPGLPDALLPVTWPGWAAHEVFAGEATRLKPASDRFVARCLTL